MSPAEDQRDSKSSAASNAATCRVCEKKLGPDAAHAPFCSDRCRMADLGKWLSGDYRISRELKDADLDTSE